MITKAEWLLRYRARVAVRWSDLTAAQIDGLACENTYVDCAEEFADSPEAAADEHMDSIDHAPQEECVPVSISGIKTPSGPRCFVTAFRR